MNIRRIADAAMVVALLAGIYRLSEMSEYTDGLETALSASAVTQVRADFRDRAMGRSLDLDRLEIPNSAGAVLYWHIDFERCTRCFNSIATWNHLASSGRVLSVFSYSGTPDASALRAIHSMSGTEIREIPQTRFQEAVGASLASSKILLDASGSVLLADTRYGGQECGWSFDEAAMRFLATASVPATQ